jgi:dolichyl-phosphate beta-glucosyltransferase
MPAGEPDQPSYELAVIIPFFNEEKRIDVAAYSEFARQNSSVVLILVNDGSSDSTPELLNKIYNLQEGNISVLNLQENRGKANAIRQGYLHIQSGNIPYIGYLDADLSTSFDSFLTLYKEIKRTQSDGILGSRIKKIDTKIERKLFRHICGRLIATLIDTKYRMGCYDTQCGAKIFKKPILDLAIRDPFLTKWFFDVEIILRIKSGVGYPLLKEVALDKWIHKRGSKISALSAFQVFKEIFVLFRKYP